MEAAQRRQYGGEEGHVSIRCCIYFSVLQHFSAGSIVEQHIRVPIAQLPIAAHIALAVTHDVVQLSFVDDHIAFVGKVDWFWYDTDLQGRKGFRESSADSVRDQRDGTSSPALGGLKGPTAPSLRVACKVAPP